MSVWQSPWPDRVYGADTSASVLTQRERVLVEAIAARVVEMLGVGTAPRHLVDAATLAQVLGVSRDCVYDHADELGGERIGDGPRARLRFDLDTALSAWTPRSVSRESPPAQTPVDTGSSARRKRRRLGTSRELLPIRGSASGSDAGQDRP